MTYPIRIETYNGSVSVINLPSKGAVAQFISTYPEKLPIGISEDQFYTDLGKELVKQIKDKIGSE